MYLTEEQKKKYKIMSRKACERYCRQKHDKTSLIISIRSTWDKVMPEVYVSVENGVKHILSLAFDDIDREDDENHAMKECDGRQIAEIVEEYNNEVDRIIVHCDGGVSRSAGVTAAIMRAKEGDDYPIFLNRRKHPNMTCYLMTLKGFGYI